MNDETISILEIEVLLNDKFVGSALEYFYVFPDVVKLRISNYARHSGDECVIVLGRETGYCMDMHVLGELLMQRVTSIIFDENMDVTISFFERKLSSPVYSFETFYEPRNIQTEWLVDRKLGKMPAITKHVHIGINETGQ